MHGPIFKKKAHFFCLRGYLFHHGRKKQKTRIQRRNVLRKPPPKNQKAYRCWAPSEYKSISLQGQDQNVYVTVDR